MFKFHTLPICAALTIALSPAMAGAQTPPPAPVKAAATTHTVTTVHKPAVGASKTTVARTTVARKTAATPAGRMVTTTTTSGKKITYDCSKAGNKAKQACK